MVSNLRTFADHDTACDSNLNHDRSSEHCVQTQDLGNEVHTMVMESPMSQRERPWMRGQKSQGVSSNSPCALWDPAFACCRKYCTSRSCSYLGQIGGSEYLSYLDHDGSLSACVCTCIRSNMKDVFYAKLYASTPTNVEKP